MKKEILTHFVAFSVFFALITLIRGWFDLSVLLFWFGGVLGTMLPDIDHVIYIYFLRSEEYNSQRAVHMVQGGNLKESFKFLAETRSERTRLIFHTYYFQLIFYVLSFLVITSSGSMFGRGLVLAFLLHLLVDQLIDFKETGSINNWFKDLPVMQEVGKQKIYLTIVSVAFLLFAFLL